MLFRRAFILKELIYIKRYYYKRSGSVQSPTADFREASDEPSDTTIGNGYQELK
jgi:hypothetical protein